MAWTMTQTAAVAVPRVHLATVAGPPYSKAEN